MIPAAICDLATSVVLLYCGLCSFRALQSFGGSDDKQWLTFWLLFSVFDLAAGILDYVSFVIPFYHEIKLGFVVFLGMFGGASVVYPVLEPIFLKADEVATKYENDKKIADFKAKVSSAVDSKLSQIDSKINELKGE
mmetsp:Transcript_30296/g.50340  ORF Transcript_30296/g.50340 Transcript_30296/m.50340 type:complete len:137 (-) Transcript_30296:624-1034(-)